ncbi:hypothetical protein [Micromonospora sp. WMMD1274]|uniref:hypothetical protein n=1 Tax=Micromonospora sp. WMMD1274 TaxID=3404116 RepID=UPI003B93292F
MLTVVAEDGTTRKGVPLLDDIVREGARRISPPRWRRRSTRNWPNWRSNLTSRAGGWRLAAGGWRLAAGGWRLAAGGWRLAAGGWRLAAGGWRLAAGGA